MIIHRRNFITGLTALIAAPAIVRASSLMSVRAMTLDDLVVYGRSPAMMALLDLQELQRMTHQWLASSELVDPARQLWRPT